MTIKKVISPPRSDVQALCRGSRDVERGGEEAVECGAGLQLCRRLLVSTTGYCLMAQKVSGWRSALHEAGGKGEVCGCFRVGHRQKALVRRNPDWLLVQRFLEENEGSSIS